MGFRTVVVLFNDQSSEWSKDPNLGTKISHAMNFAMGSNPDPYETSLGGYGRVVECAHADTQTLAVLDSYTMRQIAHSHWRPHEEIDKANERLIREAAEQLGYRLVKKSPRKVK